MFKNKINPNISKTLLNFLIKNKWMIFIFFIWGVSFNYYIKETFKTKSSITVIGNSSQQVQNQIANYSLYLNTKDEDRNVAIDITNQKSNDILERLRDYNIDEKNIEIANMNIYLDQNYIEDEIVQGDWNASINIDIKINDVDRVDRITALLAQLDVNNFYGPNFSTDAVNLDETEIVNLAIKDAHNKALNIAKYTNYELGDIISISEDITGQNTLFQPRMASFGGAEFLPGSTDIYKSVVITYETNKNMFKTIKSMLFN